MAVTLDRAAGPPELTSIRDAPDEARRAPARLAAFLAVGLALAAIVVSPSVTGVEAVRAVLIVVWAAAGLVLSSRSSLRRLAAIVFAGTIVGALCFLAAAARDAEWTGSGEAIVTFLRAMAPALIPAVALHFLVSLPSGTLRTGARKVTVLVAYVLAAALGMGLWLGRPSFPTWPYALEMAAALAVGIPVSNLQYRRVAGVERQRLEWLGCALAVVAAVGVVGVALRVLVSWPPHGGTVFLAFTALVPLSLMAGVSPRYVTRADRALVTTVSLTGLISVVAAVYLGIVLGIGRTPNASERTLLLLSMLAAGVAALLYLPARERMNQFANNLVYGAREAPDEVVRSFGSRLSRAIPMDELLLQLAESLRKTLGLVAAEVWTGTPGVYQRVVSVPDRDVIRVTLDEQERGVVARAGVCGPAKLAVWFPAILEGRGDRQLRVAPVTNSGELLGLIVVERPVDGEVFSDEDERVLTELARQVGLALHNVQLDSALQASLDEVRRQAEELQASRARIVSASDAARRAIERNLHDGAQQHLVALAVKVRLASQVMDKDTEAAKSMLDELRTDLQAAVQELRDLAHGIYPPLLMDRGLGEALRAAAGRAGLPTEVEADDLGRYDTDAEAAVYFCCLEAMQNASKHAGPDASMTVRVQEVDGFLQFEVTDDGAGFDAAAYGRGAGFVNMADRVGAIGGEVSVTSTPGEGTAVRGRVPALPR